ncbi:septum formation initiator family protein [Deltaproteobacteria bacterium OttesenSCG-928-M10]|nr:septum formation initiator family protein [Deltaproteobacteria bacterium OttesenSCG-928-M10]
MSELPNRADGQEPLGPEPAGLTGRIQSAFSSLPKVFLTRLAITVLVSAALAGGINMLVTADGFVKQSELEQKKRQLEAEIEELKDENRVLRQTLERYQNDPAFVEDEVRKKLGLIRPGETVYRLSEEPDLTEENRNRPAPPSQF